MKLCKENVNKLFFTSFKIKNYLSYIDPIPDDLKLSWYINLLVLAVVLAILANLFVILKLGLSKEVLTRTSLDWGTYQKG